MQNTLTNARYFENVTIFVTKVKNYKCRLRLILKKFELGGISLVTSVFMHPVCSWMREKHSRYTAPRNRSTLHCPAN